MISIFLSIFNKISQKYCSLIVIFHWHLNLIFLSLLIWINLLILAWKLLIAGKLLIFLQVINIIFLRQLVQIILEYFFSTVILCEILQIWNSCLSQCCSHFTDVSSSPLSIITNYFLHIEILICHHFILAFIISLKSRNIICNFHNVVYRYIRINIKSECFLWIFVIYLTLLIVYELLGNLFVINGWFFGKFRIQFHYLLLPLLINYKVLFYRSFRWS